LCPDQSRPINPYVTPTVLSDENRERQLSSTIIGGTVSGYDGMWSPK